MSRQRLRFFAALAAYVGWIAALVVMGATSAEPPPTQPPAAPADVGAGG